MYTEGEPESTANTCLSSETILEQHDQYIKSQVRERLYQRSGPSRSVDRDMDIDDLAQRVRIKFWQALEERSITYPKAYIRSIVNSEIIDMLRRRKPLQPLAIDEEGEIYQGHLLVARSQEMTDPADILEERVEADLRLQELVNALPALGDRQRTAILCTLYDRAEDPGYITTAFAASPIPMAIDTWEWPAKRSEKQLLHASLPYARRNIACRLKGGAVLQKKYLSSPRKRRFMEPSTSPTEGLPIAISGAAS